MSRSLILAGLLVDSWRDQSPQKEPSEITQPQDAIPSSQMRDTSDNEPTTPRLTSLIALGTVKWKSHRGALA